MKRMKKILLFIFLVIMIIPISIKSVFADTICQDINEKTEEYNGVIKQINTQKCDDKDLSNVDTTCSNLYSRKNLLLSELFELDNKSSTCDKTELKNIIDNNNDNCYNDISTTINSIAKTLNKYFYVLGTFLFIIFGSLDWFKNVVGSDEKNIAKNRTNFFKRLISLILIYMLPFIVNMIFSVLPEHYRLGTKKYICATQSYYVKRDNLNINVETPTPTTTPTTTPTPTPTTTVDAKKNKAKRNAIAAAAKKGKKYTQKHKFKWCAKVGNRCKTKDVRNVLTKKNKQKKISCATLVSYSLYTANIYSAEEINSISPTINNARGVAIFLIKKGWKTIKKRKDLEPGDVMFFYDSSKTAIKVPGIKKKQKPGHVEIYAYKGYTYNSGGDGYLAQIETPDNHGGFIFALRYTGE